MRLKSWLSDRPIAILGISAAALFSTVQGGLASTVSFPSASDGQAGATAPQHAESFQTDLFTGSVGTSIPIVVPPGTAGMQPSLSLVYSSSDRHNTDTLLGPGWSLSGLGYIERSTKRGAPNFTSSDSFALALNGVAELVYVPADGFYHTKDESFARIQFVTASNHWIVTNKSGVQYRFGANSDSRVLALDRNAVPRRWLLDLVTDTHGNMMSISYTADSANGMAYPATITYTQGNGLTTFRTVEFQYEARTDAVTDYRYATPVTINQRLAYIDVKMNGAMVRRYEVTYTESANAKNALLATVGEFGADATSARGTGTSAPATTFEYSSATNNFSGGGSTPWLTQPAFKSVVADFTGDGRADVAYCLEASSFSWYLAASTGTAFSASGPFTAPFTCNQTVVSLEDFNGDGKADLAVVDDVGVLLLLSTGTGFVSNGWIWWTGPEIGPDPVENYQDAKVFFADMDADGKTDLAYTLKFGAGKSICVAAGFSDGCVTFNVDTSTGDFFGGANSGQWALYQHQPIWTKLMDVNGDSKADLLRALGAPDNGIHVMIASPETCSTSCFASANSGIWRTPNPPTDPTDPLKLWRFGDFNGDALQDFLTLDATNRQATVYVNRGNGFAPGALWLNIAGAWNTTDALKVQVADFNGDGKADLIDHQTSGAFWDAHLSTGAGFNATGSGNWAAATSGVYSPHFDDFDGDGKRDLLESFATSTGELRVHLSAGAPIHLATVIKNGLGGRITNAYTTSAAYVNGYLPFTIQTVSSMTTDDGMGHLTTANYAYQGGTYDVVSREFRGFNLVTVTDSTGAYVKTAFLQTDQHRGRQSSVETYSSTGALYSKLVNTWGYTNPSAGITFPFLQQVDSYIYDGGASSKQTQTKYSYDGYGNISRIDAMGDTSTALDDSYKYSEFAYNTAAWIVDRPNHTYTKKTDNATTVAESWLYYDGAATYTSAPLKGNVTKTCRWFSAGANPCSTVGYDPYGNPTSTVDPNNRRTTIAYDSVYGTFPVTQTNALNQSVTTTYWGINTALSPSVEGSFSVPGLVATVTDPNSQRTESYWDARGRSKALVVPPDTATAPTTVSTYYFDGTAPEWTLLQKRETIGGGTLDSYAVVDGLGRTIQTKSESADATNQIVVDTTYNNRGLVETVSVPYFTATSTGYSSPDPSVKKSVTAYDAVGRMNQITNTDGTFSSRADDKWTTTFIDANGRKRVEFRDAVGQLIKVEEYTGSDGRNPSIPASPYSLYATTTYAYDTLGSLTQTTDAMGNIATIAYDTLGRKISMHDPDMGDWTYRYDAAGNLLSQTDAKGQLITFTYDELNRIKTKVVGSQTTTFVYDTGTNGVGRVASVTDPVTSTAFTYDRRGNIIKTVKTVDANSYTTQQTVDSLNRVMTLTYPDNDVVTYGYDAGGNLETVAGYVTNTNYNALGQRTNMGLGNGTSTSYTYDANHFRLNRISTSGKATPPVVTDQNFEGCTTIDADPPGWSVNNAADTGCSNASPHSGAWRAHAVRNGYLSQPITLTKGTTYTFYVYAMNGATGQTATLQVSSAPGGGTTYCSPAGTTATSWTLMSCAYTPTATVTAYINLKAGAHTTSFARFDDLSMTTTTAVTDPGFENCTTVGGAAPGWSASSTTNTGCSDVLPQSGRWRGHAVTNAYLYQPITLSAGQMYTFSVYAMNGGTGQTATLQVSSAPGGGTTYCSPAGTTATSWTLMRCTYIPTATVTAYVNLKAGAHTTSYARFDGVSVESGPAVTNYGFETCTTNDADPPNWSASSAAGTGCSNFQPRTQAWRGYAQNSAYLYQAVSLQAGLMYTFTAYAYNGGADQSSTLQISSSPGSGTTYCSDTTTATTWTQLRCSYTPASGMTVYLNLKGGASNAYGGRFDDASITAFSDIQNATYQYDGIGQVMSITDATTPGNTQSFSYDDINRLKRATGAYGTLSYAYNTIGNLTCNSQLSACSEAGPNYIYPPSGATSIRPHAVTTAAGNSYTYDANGNLLTGAGRTLSYNAENRLAAITIGSATTTMAYDTSGARVKKTANGTTTVYVGSLYECASSCTKYIFAGGQRIAAKPVGANTVAYYFHPDHLSSTTMVTDQTGEVIQRLAYSPYGQTTINSGTVDVPHKYTGQRLDDSTGLYYYGARYYDPVLGRFPQADTVIPNPGDPQALNRYTYTRNNPIRYSDPTGHAWYNPVDVVKGAADGVRDVAQNSAAAGVALQVLGGPFSGPGTYMMTRSEQGRNILAAEILVGSIVAGMFCGNCTAPMTAAIWGSVAGQAAGAYGAHRRGTGLLTGVIRGGVVGAAAGAAGAGAASLAGGGLGGAVAGGGAAGFIGGTGSTLAAGGSLGDALEAGVRGAALGAAIGGVTYVSSMQYQAMTGRAATPASGSPGGRYDGVIPPEGQNVFGTNTESGLLRQGGAFSNIANQVPGMNALAVLHDTWMNLMSFNLVTNIGTMPFALTTTYAALLSDVSIQLSAARPVVVNGF